MILNKRYKCPVCEVECITLKDRLPLLYKGSISCKSCNTRLGLTALSLFLMTPFYLYFIIYFFIEEDASITRTVFIAFIIMLSYEIIYAKLEDHGKDLPKFKS